MKDYAPTEQDKLDLQYHSMRIVADNIRCMRKKMGLTQMELAYLADLYPWQISRLEWNIPHIDGNKGYYRVHFQTLCQIASVFDISVADLCREGFCHSFVIPV